MNNPRKFWLLFAMALLIGLLLGWVDSRPTWDDTAITVGSVFLTTGILGAIMPERAWVWALLVGGAISALNITAGSNYSALFSLLIAFGGAYTGKLLKNLAG